jgi:hypothetical protein
MKETNLNIFYQLGYALAQFESGISVHKTVADVYLSQWPVLDWMRSFLEQMKELPVPDSRAAAMNIFQIITDITKGAPTGWQRNLTPDEVGLLFNDIAVLGKAFANDADNLSGFTVTPKGTYDTRILIEHPEKEYPADLHGIFPDKFLGDLQQAARCLVFDIPVGCAFHVCRATESLMISYHEKLTKQPWPFPKNRDWSAYIDHLIKQGAPITITSRLREIKDTDRNAYIHPDKDVSLDEAQVLYKLCVGVNFYMLQAMSKL